MLSEGRRQGLRLALSRSLSEPGVPQAQGPLTLTPSSAAAYSPNSAPGFPCSISPPLFPAPQVVSMPASPCSESVTIQKSLLLRRIKWLEAADVARRLTRTSQKARSFLLLDLRSFVAFNLRHVRGSINLNCSDRINRRRLLQKRATVVDLAVSPAGREMLKKRCFKEIIVYDDGATRDVDSLSPQHPVFLVLMALLEDNREPLLLKGGFTAFQHSYPELCEDALMRSKSDVVFESSAAVDCFSDPTTEIAADPCSRGIYVNGHSGSGALSPASLENAIEHAPVTEVLPFLYLGNARDAKDYRVLEALGISQVLNVTSHAPVHYEGSTLHCKTLPALDSGAQNLRQYFDEAIGFIDNARKVGTRVLVHCQAGVSRSPTIVLAYLMKHTRMTMLDSYKLLKTRRPIISPNLNFMGQLVEWETALQASKSEPDCKPCHQCQWEKQESKKAPPSACQV